jgi:hypothetical protein
MVAPEEPERSDGVQLQYDRLDYTPSPRASPSVREDAGTDTRVTPAFSGVRPSPRR